MAFVVTDNDVLIERLELGPFGTNAYVVVCRATGDSVLIDAPGEASKILERFTGNNPQYILLTHAHVDHLGALPELRYKLRVPLAAHPLEAATMPSPPEILLGNGDILSLGKIELKVLHTPGHTPGSLCFLTGQYLIAGDTIFPGGPGKTSSPKALREIIESIAGKIFLLPDDTQVYPGHGDSTVLKKEKEEFAVFSSRSHNPQLCGDVLWLSS